MLVRLFLISRGNHARYVRAQSARWGLTCPEVGCMDWCFVSQKFHSRLLLLLDRGV